MKTTMEDDKASKTQADGILAFIWEICRVSHAPGLVLWCTPGHNRGKAGQANSRLPVNALAGATSALQGRAHA